MFAREGTFRLQWVNVWVRSFSRVRLKSMFTNTMFWHYGNEKINNKNYDTDTVKDILSLLCGYVVCILYWWHASWSEQLNMVFLIKRSNYRKFYIQSKILAGRAFRQSLVLIGNLFPFNRIQKSNRNECTWRILIPF